MPYFIVYVPAVVHIHHIKIFKTWSAVWFYAETPPTVMVNGNYSNVTSTNQFILTPYLLSIYIPLNYPIIFLYYNLFDRYSVKNTVILSVLVFSAFTIMTGFVTTTPEINNKSNTIIPEIKVIIEPIDVIRYRMRALDAINIHLK